MRKLPIDQRDDYLRRAIGDDEQLMQRIRELLQTHEQIDARMDSHAKQQANETNSVNPRPELEPTSDLAAKDPQGGDVGDSLQTVTFDADRANQPSAKSSDHRIRPGDRNVPFHLLQPRGQGDMGVNLWGTSPLYENGNCLEDRQYTESNQTIKSSRRRQLRKDDRP